MVLGSGEKVGYMILHWNFCSSLDVKNNPIIHMTTIGGTKPGHEYFSVKLTHDLYLQGW